jgi:hypothetical protein
LRQHASPRETKKEEEEEEEEEEEVNGDNDAPP